MVKDEFIVMRETVDKLLEEFFTTEKRSSITIKKRVELDAEEKPFPAFEVILKGRK